MANYDFVGVNGASLPSGLTARNGTFEIQDNHAVATSPEPVNPRWVFTLEGTADGNLSAPIFVGADSGSSAGFTLRYNPADGSHIFVNMSVSNDEVRFYTFNGSAYAQIGAESYTFLQNNSYTPSAEMDGDSIIIFINGAPLDAISTTFNQNQVHHGIRLNKLDQYVDSVEFTEAEASGGGGTVEEPAISIGNAPKNNHPYQRKANGFSSVSFPVAYTGSPSGLRYRLLDASDGVTVHKDWSTFDSNPSNGTATLNIAKQPSLTPLIAEVGFTDDATVSATQTNNWYVGDIIPIFGQSLSEDLNTDGAVTPPDGYFVYSGGSFVTPSTGMGANAIASAIIEAENCPVFIINTGVGGTALTQESGESDYWNRSSGGSLWSDTVSAVDIATDGENDVAFAWWHQGTKDSLEGVTEAQYLNAMNEFFTRVRSTFTGKGSTLDIIMATFGRDTRGTATNASHQAIRDAQISYIESDANAYPVNVYTSQNEDGVHATDAAYIALGQQIATMYYVIRGLVTGSELAITSVSTGDTASEIDITFDADLLSTDSVYSTEGIHVEDDGTPLTVTSFEKKSARVATITVSETPIGTLSVWLAYGKGSTASGLTYPRSEAISLPNSAGAFSLVASAFSDYQVSAQAVNVPPTANAGTDLPTVTAGAQFQLNGSGVANQAGAAIVGYSWAQTSTGTVVALSNSLINNPTGVAPSSDAAQTLTYELTVTDSNGLTAKDTVDVPVSAFVDTTPPVIVLEGGNIALNVGEAFQEPGYKAYDNQGNEITLNVVVTGSTETTFPRVGTLEYNVTANGIAAETQTRIFTVTAESELLEEVSKQRFVLKDNKILNGFAGRSNLEKIQFKPSSTNPAIALDKQGCYDFDENETQVVEVITPSGLISSANGDVEWEGSDLYIRTGAFSSIKKHESARVVVYLANDTRGVVFAGPGLNANLIIHFN